MSASKRFSLVSLGCSKNQVDSEAIQQLLVGQGFENVAATDDADLIVVNTCGFIDAAKQESIDTLLELGQRKRPGQRLLATGCLTERYGGELAAEIGEIDAVVGARNWTTVPRFAEELTVLPAEQVRQPGSSLDLIEIAPAGALDLEMPRRAATGPSAYVKISDGCNQKCAFCAIPNMKGLLRSKSPELILREVGELLEQDVREVVLVAQDSTNYGRDWGAREGLAELLERICDTYPGLPWLRVMYAYPSHVSERFLRVMEERPQLCRYLDLPLQHTHPATLKRMRRPHRPVEELMAWIRAIVPDITIRTTFIVGFPGETEEEHRHVQRSIETLGFGRVGVFTYSDEEGTAAFDHEDRVARGVKQRRRHELMVAARAASLEAHRALVGRQIEVLVEGEGELGERTMRIGRSRRDAPEVDGLVFVDGVAQTGEIVAVEVTQALEYDLVGRLVESSGN
ncbi:MAG: 30S ribosomal protein S12 methylthiotransferase RimO [Chloroflexi bacterium]|nr:30S ribosomal protein S12 methylthiotransferase RimO [Chloroflexota bacterium]